MGDTVKPEMIELSPPEKSRTYSFPGGEGVVLRDVTHFLSRESGHHRLRTADGRLHVVPPGWNHIEIEAADWTL